MTDILPPAGWPNVRQLETNEFAAGGANGNMNEQAKSLAARSELLKKYVALPYESKTGGYALNERVQLPNGDIVCSTIASNVKNPNVDMTGWVNTATWSSIKNKPTTVAGYGITDAYTKTEVNTAISNATPTIPNATETVAGKAKIATTAIAQAGVDDTDFITALKLRNALNANGSAPMFACRAWVNFNGAPLSGTYSQSGTTVTVTMTAHGMSVGQNVNLTFTSGTAVSGSFTVTSIASAGTFTITASTSLSTSGNVTRNLHIRASGNVSSVTDNGIGLYTVNFTTAMQDANYSAIANYSSLGTASVIDNDGNASCNTYLTTSVTLAVMNGAAVARDAAYISVSITR